MNIAHWLWRTARDAPELPAILLGDVVVADYKGFLSRAARVSGSLTARGVEPGDRVALFAANAPEYLAAMFGIWMAGAVTVPINAKLHAKEAAFVCEACNARLILVDATHAAGLTDLVACPVVSFREVESEQDPVIRERGPDELAWLFYTSGTTGRPKGVRITHGMLSVISLAYLADVDQVGPGMSALYAAPISHGAGLYAPVHVLKGAAHIFPASGRYDPAEVLDLSEAHGATSMFLAPTMIRRLLAEARQTGRDGSGIRTIVYGGGPMYLPDIVKAVAHFGPRFVQIFGQGECPMSITCLSRKDVADRTHPRWMSRLTSVGRPHSCVTVRVLGPDGAERPPGEAGEIAVQGAAVMSGYWNAPDATAETIRDGWLMTGDVGMMDEDGYLTLVDRSKDVIISGGTNVYPREVEDILLSHPSISEAAVFGLPSEEWGEDVAAAVVVRGGAAFDEDAVDAHCRDCIAGFKRPKHYFELSSLPTNANGKVEKTSLREICWARKGGQ